jgi:fibronectin type 3 domain-containing protein
MNMRKPNRPFFSWPNQAFRFPDRPSLRAWVRRARLEVEWLEARTLPSGGTILADMAHPNYVVQTSGNILIPFGGIASAPYSPSQIRSAYGFNLLSVNGAGQTIAIVDAYDAPTIQGDLQAFDQQYGLPAANLTVVNQTGGSSLPSPDPGGGWGVETSLDVEWAHALAPGANLLLVEANSANTNDLFAGASYAASQHGTLGVSVISMSFGAREYSTETADDSTFKTAATSGGVTFVGATGDGGYPASYPAFSPYVVAVGGTSLQIDTSGAYISETGWSGSGGGISVYESQPSYQKGVVTQSTTKRTVPDVAFDADANTGVWIYDSFNNPYGGPWTGIGGTSFATPAWATIVALSNEIRAQSGQAGQTASLNGYAQTLPNLYKLPASDFHDITSGNNGKYSAGVGYDLVTGRGSPIVNQLVFDLAGVGTTPVGVAATPGEQQVTLTWSAEAQAGTTFNVYRGTSPGGEGASPIATGVTAMSFTDTGLTDGTAYYYQVAAVNAGVTSARSSEVSATPRVQPPLGLTVAPGNTKITLTWTTSAGATSYNVYRGTSTGGEGANPIASGVTSTSFTDIGLTNGTTYYYQVTAVNAGGESSRSAEVSAAPVGPPSAPTGVAATGGNTQIRLTWTAPPGAASYNVYRGTTPGGEGASPVATGITTTSFIDMGLTDGATYYYRVTAVNAGGEGGKSAEVSATAQFLILAINAGGGVVGSFVADTDFVGNSWTYVTNSSIDSSGVFQAPPQSVLQSMRYADPPGFGYNLVGLTPGASYTVRLDFVEPTLFAAGKRVFNVTLNGTAFLTNFDIYVAAGNVGNKAVAEASTATADANGQISIAFSNIANDPLVCGIEVYSATPIQTPPAPANLVATASLGQVGLSWTPVTGATYNVYRGTGPGGEGATPLASGVTSPSFIDTHVTPGTTYYYQVTAVNLGGEGARSSEQSATPQGLPPYRVLAIDAGGGAVGSFVADTDFVGNSLTYTTTATIDTSGVYQAPPQTIFQSMRYANAPGFGYNLVGLTPGATYTVRLDFVEPTLFGAGERVFNVTLNGAAFLTNFDIYVAAGDVGNKAVGELGTATADVNGQISIGFSNVANDPLVCGIEVYSATPIQAPPAPTNLVATANVGQVGLTWTAVAGATSYNVYRGTTPGGEGATPLATVTSPAFLDVHATPGTTYYYQVTAVNLGGEGARSSEQSATPQGLPPYRVVAIDAGGGAVGSFVADTDFVGNSLTYSTTASIDTSGVYQAPPQSVYQSMRYANPPGFGYNLVGLTPGATYTVRLHFVEPTLFGAGERVFNVTLNGAAFLTNFDIYVAAGYAGNKAVAEVGTATADVNGQISIGFSNVANDPLVCAIDVFSMTPPQAPPAPTKVVASVNVGQVELSWTAAAGATSYNVYRGTSPGGEGATPLATAVTGTSFTDHQATPGTTYYYQVSAVNVSGEGARSSEQSASAQFTTVLAIDAGGGAVGSFAADADFVGNSSTYVTTATIDTSGVYQAPPQAVFQSMRYASPPGFGYNLVGLTPGATYTVRLDFVEPTLFGAGERVFNVTLNGAAFLTNFDIYVAAGYVGNKAVAEVGTATADANGQISIGFSNVANDPLVCGIEVFSTTPVQPPPAPTSVVASVNIGQVGLSWSAVAGATSYNVYRGTSPGGEGATPLATGVTGTSFIDNQTTPGTTYYYQVSAVNLGGAGPRSSEQSSSPQFTTVLAIDAGGGAVGSFVADTDFVGNSSTYVTSATIDTSGVFQAPPQSVYQSMRYANPPGFGYNIVGLSPGVTYTVRLHFVEPTLFGAGERVFNVTLNGTAFLTNFDIYVAAGYVGNKAVAEVGTAVANANGQISIGISNVANDPLVCAIEILLPTSGMSPHFVTVGSKQTPTTTHPVATRALDQFFALEGSSHSQAGAAGLNPFDLMGQESAVATYWREPYILTGSGNGSPDDSKGDPLQVQDEGPDVTDWTIFLPRPPFFRPAELG